MRAKKISTLQELERKNPSTPNNPNTLSTPSSSKQDFAQQKALAAERRKKEKQIAEVEAVIADLEAQQAQMEELLSLPENQTTENFHQYESIKHQIEQKMYEWEILSE